MRLRMLRGGAQGSAAVVGGGNLGLGCLPERIQQAAIS